MRVLLLSWSDSHGGAARATVRLHRALRAAGVESSMLVADRTSDDPYVLGPETMLDKMVARIAPHLELMALKFRRLRPSRVFSPGLAYERTVHRVRKIAREITHLHWPNNGFLRQRSWAQLGQPLVWTFHDMWAFTGGCHYSGDCRGFEEQCGNCPALNSSTPTDFSRRCWQRKAHNWRELKPVVITPSQWLGRQVVNSSLFRDARVEVIPNCLDLRTFRPHSRHFARDVLGLPQEPKIVLFTALTAGGDPRKGFHLLQSALETLAIRIGPDAVHLAVIGMSQAPGGEVFPFPVHYLGMVHDDATLALAYSAANVFVAPSVEDNLPNTVVEALSCGLPSVAFAIGGMPDMIRQCENGYLARPFSCEDLASGIEWVIADETRWRELSANSRAGAEKQFAPDRVAVQHIAVYDSLIKR